MRALLIALVASANLLASPPAGSALKPEIKVQVSVRSDLEQILSTRNILQTKQYILSGGKTRAYSNKYNNNPFTKSDNYEFYLIPDSGPDGDYRWNADCDPKKGDFNSLIIFKTQGVPDVRTIHFEKPPNIMLEANWVHPSFTIQQLRDLPEQAILELLTVIQNQSTK